MFSPQVNAAIIQLLGVLLVLGANTWLAFHLYEKTSRRERQAKRQEAYRKLLEPHIPVLTDALHQTLALSRIYVTILMKRRAGCSAGNQLAKAQRATTLLRDIRPKLIVPLWGITDELYGLTRLPSWLAHARDDAQRMKRIFRAADKLRKQITILSRNCLMRGTPPSHEERRTIRALYAIYENAFDPKPLANERNRLTLDDYKLEEVDDPTPAPVD